MSYRVTVFKNIFETKEPYYRSVEVIIDRIKQGKSKALTQLILMEPFLFCADRENPRYQTLQIYIGIVRKLAEEFNAVLVSCRDRIDEQIKQVPPERWAHDMVHPALWAHAWICRRWFEATKL